ncbi:uncharacterized protein LOC5575427 isoform X4 [Aedes aegypti]|uniref:Uncharacterized protein n=1 Tax=Aedes aegypti TaxID=7159 RepID=A0A6I8U3K7_AEDAE|nr:uncharacterized protein LOC5575427 isoform X4 [Aedes aegypti]
MSQRNLTDLYSMLRNNVVYNKHLYTDTNNSDHIALLDHGLNEADDPEQPAWIRIYDDIVCLLTRTQTKIDDLVHIQDAPARLVLNENGGDELKIQQLSKDVSLLLSAVHGKIKALKSNSRVFFLCFVPFVLD